MTISNATHDDVSPSPRSFAVTLYSGLFILLGIGALILLILTINNDPLIQAVVNWSATEEFSEPPSLIVTFLSQLGIVVPVLLLGMGIIFVRLGVRLLGANIRDGYWAQIALLWLSVGMVLLAGINLLNVARALAEQDTPAELVQFSPVVVPLLLFVPLLASWYWLSQNLSRIFRGDDPLPNQQARFAWNLLIPSLFIFVLVAARPLEQTFIRSLTDKQFGTAQVPHFVGLDNYTDLLRMRLDTVPCRIDDETNECATRRDGSIRWE
ncbi:MAG: sugar ABC transporter permease, partial [Anaerolineae bacterium]|nr:sugar ABC transporter permease [Anaerolineae bacterium]